MTPFNEYLLLTVFLVVAVAFALVPLGLARVLGPRKPNPEKQDTYECGLEAKGDPWGQFKVQYYLVALASVIFGVEAAFLYPWAVAFTGVGLGGFLAMAVFIFILAESLVYLWAKGALEWK